MGRHSRTATSQKERRAGSGGNTSLLFHFLKKRKELTKRRLKGGLSWAVLAGPIVLFFGWLWAAASRTATSQERRQAAQRVNEIVSGCVSGCVGTCVCVCV